MDQHLVPAEIAFAEAVCRRPRMYTATGTLEEVFCFLNGFYSGLMTHTDDPRAMNQAERDWFKLLEFVNPANSESQNREWRTFYRTLRQAHTEDTAAFAQILTVIQEYRRLVQGTGSSDKANYPIAES